MNNTLNSQIAASYFGAEVKVNGYYNNDSTPKEIVGTMTHVGLMSIGTGGGQYSYSQCQLILTPISKISDEDAVEVTKIMQSATNVDWVGAGKDSVIAFLHTAILGYESSFEDEDSRVFLSGALPSIIHYCQSHSIDIGHGYGDNHIPSLIAAGVAVEKK